MNAITLPLTWCGCQTCGLPYVVPSALYYVRTRANAPLYCPSGHPNQHEPSPDDARDGGLVADATMPPRPRSEPRSRRRRVAGRSEAAVPLFTLNRRGEPVPKAPGRPDGRTSLSVSQTSRVTGTDEDELMRDWNAVWGRAVA